MLPEGGVRRRFSYLQSSLIRSPWVPLRVSRGLCKCHAEETRKGGGCHSPANPRRANQPARHDRARGGLPGTCQRQRPSCPARPLPGGRCGEARTQTRRQLGPWAGRRGVLASRCSAGHPLERTGLSPSQLPALRGFIPSQRVTGRPGCEKLQQLILLRPGAPAGTRGSQRPRPRGQGRSPRSPSMREAACNAAAENDRDRDGALGNRAQQLPS